MHGMKIKMKIFLVYLANFHVNRPYDCSFDSQRQPSMMSGFRGTVNFPEQLLKSDPVAVTWYAPLQHSPAA
jgi:hypothetical protein